MFLSIEININKNTRYLSNNCKDGRLLSVKVNKIVQLFVKLLQ